ncbi:MarR family transcriptional regulator [Dactylosporangium fulvum]|uniref:MarR family transcriptional regulator n=1 Tax=Dactylosporangium fulvum TaxID=53359 RepID=A0ABY5VXB2_9ACTN|nr:MarR family transcriptional regulator [Dactylosporangium fulvum]UWP82387.1 MarR family transcriptional regulator [Dactylosporangium fulvum]
MDPKERTRSTDPDRLDPLDNSAWSGLLRAQAALSRELERRLMETHQMPLSTYEVLLRLAWAKEGIRMTDLAHQVNFTSGGLTRLVDRLERQGWITRTRSATDLRGFTATITSAGRKALKRANRQHLADVRELFLDKLSIEDIAALAAIWKRLGADPPPS